MSRVRRLLTLTALVASIFFPACDSGADSDTPDGPIEQPEAKTFTNDEFGFTFRYPDYLELGAATSIDKSTPGEPVARQILFIDEDNGIIVSRYDLDFAVTDENLDDVRDEFDGIVAELTGLDVTGRRTTVGGFAAFRYDNLDLAVPPDGVSDLAFLFDGRTEYQLNCQSTPANRARVDDVCAMVFDTLEPA